MRKKRKSPLIRVFISERIFWNPEYAIIEEAR